MDDLRRPVAAMCAIAAPISSRYLSTPTSTSPSPPNSKSVDASGDGVLASAASASSSTSAAMSAATSAPVSTSAPAGGGAGVSSFLFFRPDSPSIQRRPFSAVSLAPWSPPSSVFMSSDALRVSAGGGSRPASVLPRAAAGGGGSGGDSAGFSASARGLSPDFEKTAPRSRARSAAVALRYTLTDSWTLASCVPDEIPPKSRRAPATYTQPCAHRPGALVHLDPRLTSRARSNSPEVSGESPESRVHRSRSNENAQTSFSTSPPAPHPPWITAHGLSSAT